MSLRLTIYLLFFLTVGSLGAIERWGGPGDFAALYDIVSELDVDSLPEDGRYRQSISDQAMGVLLKLNGRAPTDFLMRESTSGSYTNFRFVNQAAQRQGIKQFKAWWNYLPAGKAVLPVDVAAIDLQTAVRDVLNDQFATIAQKHVAVARLEADPVAANLEWAKLAPMSKHVYRATIGLHQEFHRKQIEMIVAAMGQT